MIKACTVWKWAQECVHRRWIALDRGPFKAYLTATSVHIYQYHGKLLYNYNNYNIWSVRIHTHGLNPQCPPCFLYTCQELVSKFNVTQPLATWVEAIYEVYRSQTRTCVYVPYLSEVQYTQLCRGTTPNSRSLYLPLNKGTTPLCTTVHSASCKARAWCHI